jgi:hypothetical protein
MGALTGISVFLSMLLVGCTSTIQVGLANAPVLGGATPDSHVSDVIANGRDSCERSMFSQGAVLRGQIPACGAKSVVAPEPNDLLWTERVSSWGPPQYSLGPCPSVRREGTRTPTGLAAISLLPSGKLCRELW